MSYKVFVRNWWKWETDRFGMKRLVPDSRARKTTLVKRVETEKEAREICKKYNDSHNPGSLSRKAEYTEI